jgi:hypothetical protein
VRTTEIAAGDPRVAAAPYVWERVGAALESSHGGAWIRFHLRASKHLALHVIHAAPGGSPPGLEVRIGSKPWTIIELSTQHDFYPLAADLAPDDETEIEIMIGSPSFGAERWTGDPPPAFARIAGFVVDSAAVLAPLVAPLVAPILLYGDSIGEGGWNLGIDVTSARRAFPATLARAMGTDVGPVCFAGQGLRYRESADHILPLFDEDPRSCTWSWYRAGRSRLSGDRLEPVPSRIVVCTGTNDGFNAHIPVDVSGAIAGLLAALRQAATDAFLHVVVPFGGFFGRELRMGFEAYRQAGDDARCSLIDLGPDVAVGLDRDRATKMRLMVRNEHDAERTNRAHDGLHPDIEAHAELGARLAAAILRAEGRALAPRKLHA